MKHLRNAFGAFSSRGDQRPGKAGSVASLDRFMRSAMDN
jgi:hypothetical protein